MRKKLKHTFFNLDLKFNRKILLDMQRDENRFVTFTMKILEVKGKIGSYMMQEYTLAKKNKTGIKISSWKLRISFENIIKMHFMPVKIIKDLFCIYL